MLILSFVLILFGAYKNGDIRTVGPDDTAGGRLGSVPLGVEGVQAEPDRRAHHDDGISAPDRPPRASALVAPNARQAGTCGLAAQARQPRVAPAITVLGLSGYEESGWS